MKPHQHLFTNKTLVILLLVMLAAGCSSQAVPFSRPTATLPPNTSRIAAAELVAEQYLEAWRAEDYDAMYDLLSLVSQDAFSKDTFESSYRNAATAMTLEAMEFQFLSARAGEIYAEVAFKVIYTTRLVGEISRDNIIYLSNEKGNWRVQWETGLIFPDLAGGNTLEFVHQLPSRGSIYDRNGAPLASYENAIAIGLVPGEIMPEQADQVITTLAEMSFYNRESLTRLIESTPDDWYLPVVSLSQAGAMPYIERLQGFAGVRIDEFRSRFYLDGGVAPHAVGYMLFIPEESLESYLRLGYRQDARIGVTGLESAFEFDLAGQFGGSLYLVGPNGNVLSLLASSEPISGQSLYTTLDKTLQMQLQASLGDLRAAVVVMEVDTGRILALVSNPHFDPNAFDLTEIDRSLLESYFTDESQPLFNRVTQGQYPLGSVFKTISMSAALETGIYSQNASLNCGYSMWVCDSMTLFDWTLDYGVAPSGELNLPEGLMRSCNPWFYRIGERLYEEDMPSALSDMAFGFGLGYETGIDIPEASGNIPVTADTCMNSAQIAIGQGEVLVTPIQVVRYFAALANGGTLYRPALINQIKPPIGDASYDFEPEPQGELPISEETLAIVQEAMRMVVEEPRGTGYWAMAGLEVPISGKTGTAQTPTGNSHAWFAGFTRKNDPDQPDIAVVVLIENGGEGSVMAAPVFRRVVSLYFSDYTDPGGLMPWEVEPFVPFEETPLPDSTIDD